MIVNIYALLAGSLAFLQLLLSGVLGILGVSVWLRWRAATNAEQKAALEDRAYLLFLLACVLAALNVASLIPAGLSHESGLFHLHFLLAFAVSILVLMVSSGIGLSERRREIGILKATGWQTDEILVRGVVESSLISITAASLALLLAFIWMRGLNGVGIAALLLPGVDLTPSFVVPCQLTPLPALLGYLFAWIIVTLGHSVRHLAGGDCTPPRGAPVSPCQEPLQDPLLDRDAAGQKVLLEARGVWKWLGQDRSRPPVLKEITLSIPRASWTLLAGPSGSGKTTLLSLLGALDRPSQGQIVFEGQDLTVLSDIALARLRRRIGFVFQDYALIPRLSLWENITYPLIPRGVGSKQRLHLATGALERVGLAGYEEKRPEELSGGERQRTAIARAITGDPGVLIADEPTSNLDVEAAMAVSQILRDLHGNGVTVLVASHDPHLASMADQRYELRNGVLVREASRT